MRQKNGKCLVYLPFTKSLKRLEHRTQHYFPRMNCSRWCQPTQLSSSTAGFSNEMKFKSRLPPFSLIHIRCQHAFCFWFHSLLPLIQILIILYADKLGILGRSVQIPCLGSGPPSTNRKILLVSLAKYAIVCSGQSDTEIDLLPDLQGFIWIRFQINHFCFSEKYANFIHRQRSTIYKAHGSDFRWGSITVTL